MPFGIKTAIERKPWKNSPISQFYLWLTVIGSPSRLTGLSWKPLSFPHSVGVVESVRRSLGLKTSKWLCLIISFSKWSLNRRTCYTEGSHQPGKSLLLTFPFQVVIKVVPPHPRDHTRPTSKLALTPPNVV